MEFINTPAGKYPVPEGIRDKLEALTDQELLTECVNSYSSLAGTSEPFLLNEVMGRFLYPVYHKILEARLQCEKELL